MPCVESIKLMTIIEAKLGKTEEDQNAPLVIKLLTKIKDKRVVPKKRHK